MSEILEVTVRTRDGTGKGKTYEAAVANIPPRLIDEIWFKQYLKQVKRVEISIDSLGYFLDGNTGAAGLTLPALIGQIRREVGQ